ncbi:peptidase, M22 family, partial [delta proteobacterium NaphS2]
DAAELDGIAVTVGPGLVGALLVGLYYAKGLAYMLRKPLVAVNHLEAHILSIFLETEYPSFPFVAMTVSGGHTSLYHVEGFGRYTLLGQTLDDAAGEAFDKMPYVWIISAGATALVVWVYNKFVVSARPSKLYAVSNFMAVAFFLTFYLYFSAKHKGFSLTAFIVKDIYVVILIEQLWTFCDATFKEKPA